MKKAKTDKFPLEIKSGSVTIKIYECLNKGYKSYSVSFFSEGKRKLKAFADLAEAKREAKKLAQDLSRGDLEATKLTGAARLAYVHALKELKPTRVPLEVAAKEYAAAFKILAGRGSILEAARDYAKRNHKGLPKLTVREAVDELLRLKDAEGITAEYRKALRCYLDKFAERFTGSFKAVTAAEISDFLRDMKVSNRSKNNCRSALTAFYKFAKQQGWLPKDHEDLEFIPKFKNAPGKIEIYTPEELVQLLRHCRVELVPYLTIGAFAGLRSAELQRLDWADIALEDGYITVGAHIAKTASRRLVPISANLKAWLMPYFQKSGRVVPFDNLPKQLGFLAKATGIKWKKNALRHSFCSYRLAELQDTAKVALEAGNSPQMIFQHYRQLVRPEEAKKWFCIEHADQPGFTESKKHSPTKSGRRHLPAKLGTR